MIEDVVPRVLAAIEETEKAAKLERCPRCGFIVGHQVWCASVTSAGAPPPVVPPWRSEEGAVLRHCAAHRRIVDMYLTELRVEQEDHPHRIGAARMWGGGKLSGARIAVVLLADGYGLVKADDVFRQMAFGTEEQPETDADDSSNEEEK